MVKSDVALMAHLMRRAGFGAPYEELETRVKKGYEATVEELLCPEDHGIPAVDQFIMERYHPDISALNAPPHGSTHFMYHLIKCQRPLEEKMALFWHMVFATGNSKVELPPQLVEQIDMFRNRGLGSYHALLVDLAKDPAMIFWLDNNMNHKDEPNENWGRELLELFSMGQGNYTEDDVKMASRAFTGWTIKPKLPRLPYGRYLWEFEYKEEDHDYGEKVFLGQKGRFDGEDIIDIIVKHPSTATFIARHLYNFFVADEVQVPSWKDIPPRDQAAVSAIADVFTQSGFEIRPTLRFLFNSDFFKSEDVWFAKVKNPAEVVAGTIRLVGDFSNPKPGMYELAREAAYQGQDLADPPSVEGWHTGHEWIDTGMLVRRINFVADKLGDESLPGVKGIIDRLYDSELTGPSALVDACLEMLGHVKLKDETYRETVEHASEAWNDMSQDGIVKREEFGGKVVHTLQLIAATREYQFC